MIELEDSEENPYDNFLESMRSSETKRMYVRNLKMFLNLIPNNIFEDYLGESPKSREIDVLATSFTALAKKTSMQPNKLSNPMSKKSKKM